MSRRPFSTYLYTAAVLLLLLLFAKNDAPSFTLSQFLSRNSTDHATIPSECPIPWLDSPLSTRKETELNCVKVATNHTEFQVKLCYDPQGCNVGHILINYLNTARCDIVEKEFNASKVVEQNNYVKGKLGPHTISVLFDGATRAGGEKMEYLGGCRYRYPFNLGNGGRFALRVVLVYQVRLRHSRFS